MAEDRENKDMRLKEIRERFVRYRNLLFKACENGYIHFCIAKRLLSYLDSPNRLHSLVFWQYSFYANVESSTSRIIKLTEKRINKETGKEKESCKDNITIYKFLNYIAANNKYLFEESELERAKKSLKDDLELFANKWSFIERLMEFRDNYYFHFGKRVIDNPKFFIGSCESDESDVENLYFLISNTLGFYSKLFDGHEYPCKLTDWCSSIEMDFRFIER